MIQSYTCANLRRLAVLEDPKNAGWNGIDYLEVAQKADGSGATLTVVFARGLGLAALTASQIRITGGVRFGPPTVATVTPDVPNRTVVVETLGATDFSAYTFTLVKSAAVDVPPDNFDPELSFLEFEFKADCPSPLDCEAPSPAPDLVPPGPSIDYLAKDFNSFRQAMLDRLSVTSPKWTERNPADLGVAIVEVLAYAGDYLSYYQDAVATEAYLGTARLRTSVRRHSRLLAYPMHDGCNARAFVFFELGGVRINLPKGAPLLIRRPDSAVLPPSALLNPQGPVFETMHAQTLWPDLNQILFHTFFDTGCVLPQGATSATLWDQTGALSTPGPNAQPLRLRPGDLMLFEEIASSTGVAADADPAIRHVVRLTSVTPWQESIVLPGEPGPRMLVDIAWAVDDALPFDFTLEAQTADGPVPRVVARGNGLLADHGQTMSGLSPHRWLSDGRLALQDGPISRQGRSRGSRDRLAKGPDDKPLSFDPAAPASSAMRWLMSDVFPEVSLNDSDGNVWLPQRDLLGSGPFSQEFVLEGEADGTERVRFGDGIFGAAPDTSTALLATYRLGNGADGNVGAEGIAHIAGNYPGINRVRNPLPATGGADPESLTSVKQFAPYAFNQLERAVTDADYAVIAQRHPGVQRAVAYRRWNGSWYVVEVLVDRIGGLAIDASFSADLLSFFDDYRMTGYDVEIHAPVMVPLDIAFTVCVDPTFYVAHVETALRQAFASAPGGFFDPDRLTFGQPVYVSEVIARAMAIQGVSWVDLDDTPPKPNRFQRLGDKNPGDYAAGKIDIKPREVARCDNDASRPENGQLQLLMRGGR